MNSIAAGRDSSPRRVCQDARRSSWGQIVPDKPPADGGNREHVAEVGAGDWELPLSVCSPGLEERVKRVLDVIRGNHSKSGTPESWRSSTRSAGGLWGNRDRVDHRPLPLRARQQWTAVL